MIRKVKVDVEKWFKAILGFIDLIINIFAY